MNRRYAIYLGLIALLILANLGRWWFYHGQAGDAAMAHGKGFQPEDFRLRVNSPVAAEPYRDLFQPSGSSSVQHASHNKPAKAKAVIPATKPAANDADVIDNGLGKLKLLGVVFRAGKGQAYLAQDKVSVIAFVGDTVFGNYAVDKVTVDAVELRDLKYNTTRRIPVSGR